MAIDKVIKGTIPYYKTAYAIDENLPIVSALKILDLEPSFSLSGGYYPSSITSATITLYFPDNTISRWDDNKGGNTIVANVRLYAQGTYRIQYQGQANYAFETPIGIDTKSEKYSFSIYFAVVENKLPLKKWTVTDVIHRTLDLAEPIRKGEKARFVFNAEQAAQFDKILAPEFSFTKQTLRECLKEVGAFIHGEPRIKPIKVKDGAYSFFREITFSNLGRALISPSLAATYREGGYYVYLNGKWEELEVIEEPNGEESAFYLIIPAYRQFSGKIFTYKLITEDEEAWVYEVSYDMFASAENSNIQYMPYTGKGNQHVIENYAGWLDSSAENLVNQLDKYSGVIVEPYKDGAKSVRTENLYVRIEEGNMLISTLYPIYSVDKIEYVYDKDGQLQSVDITPWLFEKSVYDTQLSSYNEAYPYSKAYGIYYAQGAKNIAGLNFKVDAATFAAFKNYAIVNIIRRATGDKTLFDFSLNSEEAATQYPKMCFRVTYTPFYNVRVAQTKPYYKDFSRPAALIYNQQANVIESRYYGENLKGAIARLGNTEKSITYILIMLNQIPKAGQKFNKDYYISAVATEILPTCIKCTIGLSKDFNRLSSYIGISSSKRYYEISQNQAVERNTLYREFIVVGNSVSKDDGTLIGAQMLNMIKATFIPPKTASGEFQELGPVTNVLAWGESYTGTPLNAVNLPVISSAFGNSMSFSWKYEDNYSAGARSDYNSTALEVDNKKVGGYFQNSYTYTDYYGKIYYYNFDLEFTGPAITATNLDLTAQSLPAGTPAINSSGIVSTVGKQPYIIRKDNREALQINFQVDFVTNIDTLIIGSALASYCPAVRGNNRENTESKNARLYVLPQELNKFTDHLEAFIQQNLSSLPSVPITVNAYDWFVQVLAENFPADGKAWAIVTPQQTITQLMETETGEEYEQTIYYGGDLLIGQNIEVKSGEAFTPIYLTPKREIFSKTVWKDRR